MVIIESVSAAQWVRSFARAPNADHGPDEADAQRVRRAALATKEHGKHMTGPLRPRKRFVLCMGQYCNRGGQAVPLYQRLQEELGDPVPAFLATGPVTWEVAACLDMCGGGPNLIVYPEGTIYNQLDLPALEQILDEHLAGSER
jgi:(2Fe-2S) ferredoxin